MLEQESPTLFHLIPSSRYPAQQLPTTLIKLGQVVCTGAYTGTIMVTVSVP